MQISSFKVRDFLLEVLNQTNFPGNMSEFVSDVKAELRSAQLEQETGNTASDRMLSVVAQT